MTPPDVQSRQQARLWSAAFGVSALVNLLAVLLIAVWISFRVILEVIQYAVLTALGFEPSSIFAHNDPPPPPPQVETVATIVPEVAPAVVPAPPPPTEKPFARTSKDQEAERPDKPSFIGDRNTQARSDAPAVAEAPLMPSQKGREPHYEGEVETTNSNYQDGDLASDHIAKPAVEPAIPTAPAPEPMKTPDADAEAKAPTPETAATDPSEPSPPTETKPATPETPSPVPPTPPAPEPKEKLAQGTMPVDRQVKEETPKELPKPPVPERPATPPAPPVAETPPPPKVKPQPAHTASTDSPGFRGNQQKTRLSGSITRQGGSALDVEDSLLGRYHSALSRAVEKEWQLNCVRNRDYITPGQIVVRFVLESTGKVRSLTFVEEFGVGNIQKGFTSESIRTAAIPAFPAELKKQLNGEPLEVTYSFTF